MTTMALSDGTGLFERARPRLFGIAYRMLGTIDDAEDLVQETFLRWQRAEQEPIRESEGWLVAVATRLSIDRLRRARTERAAYVGHWLPEPVPTAEWADAGERAELASDLSMAFLVMLERLGAEERAAFVLREVLDYGYDELARVLDKSEAACRQMVRRARQRVRDERRRSTAAPQVTGVVLERFLAALHAEDKDGLMALLAPDVSWTSDGGGKVAAIRNIVRGSLSVARMLLGFRRKGRGFLTHTVEWWNGEPAWVMRAGDSLFSATFLRTDGARVLAFYSVRNPDKLQGVSRSRDLSLFVSAQRLPTASHR